MPKNKEKAKLPKPEDVPEVAPLLEKVTKRKEVVVKQKAKASKDGKLDKYDPNYRKALKRLKRVQRKVIKEITNRPPPPKPKEAPAEASAEAKPAAEATAEK